MLVPMPWISGYSIRKAKVLSVQFRFRNFRLLLFCFFLLPYQSWAKGTADAVVVKQKNASIKMCDASYRGWWADNRGQKAVAAPDKDLIIQSCAGRAFLVSLKCSQNFFDRLEQEKSKGAHEASPEANSEVRLCMSKIGVQVKEDTKLLANLISTGQRAQFNQTLKGWHQDGSLRYFRDH